MKLRFSITLVALVLILSFFVVTNPAHAAGDFINVAFTGSGTCSNTSIFFPVTVSWSVTAPVTLTEVDKVNGGTVFNQIKPTGFSGSGTGSGSGFNLGAYSASQPYTFSIDLTYIEGGVTIGHTSASYTCSGGIAILPGVTGPAIPAGFVLKTITCDVAVFDSPAGHPVGANRIKAGQTWYVNPTPVKGKDGKQWTEFFAGGYTNGYIPTSCVGK